MTQQCVDYISFSPGGGWFIRYDDGKVKLSTKGSFPKAFHDLAAPYMKTRNHYKKQKSCVGKVFFGAGDAVILQMENGDIVWNGLADAIETEIRERVEAGFTLTNNSNLCQWDARYWFFEWQSNEMFGDSPLEYCWNIWPNEYINDSFIGEACEGGIPIARKSKKQNNKPPPGDKSPSKPSPAKKQPKAMGSETKISKADKKKYRGVFDAICTLTGESFVTKTHASQFMNGHGLTKKDLARIWKVADENCDGKLQRDEFITAMHLIDRAKTNGIEGSDDDGEVMQSFAKMKLGNKNDSDDDSDMEEGWEDESDDENEDNDSENEEGWEDDSEDEDEDQDEDEGEDNEDEEEEVEIEEEQSDDGHGSSKRGGDASRSKDDKQLEKSLASAIITETPNVHWDEVAGLESAKEELQEAICLPLRFPHLFQGKRKQRRGMLLYGPPGTGKSFLAKAIATEVGSTMFSISSSDILSKWFGESER